jgi:penicillin-binding protein 1A
VAKQGIKKIPWFGRIMKKFFLGLLSIGAVGLVLGIAGFFYIIHEYSHNLPDYHALAHYEPPISTRVHAGDGQLTEEFATEKRVFVPIDAVPKKVINAFLSAEDRNFYTHPGIDAYGILRAIATNLRYHGDRRPVGGSTITQQVAKNFLLGNEVSYTRKIREAIIAFRMEKTFSKDKILELYLNEIYLGKGRYGVAAAALGYFDKSLDDLTLEEIAYLATLPKAPNNYQIENHAEAAKYRRDWILSRMEEDGYIDEKDMLTAQKKPIVLHPQVALAGIDARYFNEDIRRFIINKYGENALYEGGLSVRSTLDPEYQKIAAESLRHGLISYDHRHGWRGAITTIKNVADWKKELADVKKPDGLKDWQLAVVLAISGNDAKIGLEDKTQGTLSSEGLRWTGAQKVSDKLKVGDVVAVSKDDKIKAYALQQIPKVQGAIIALDPHTGRVLAMQGGYDYGMSEFNRASQALRQPGSSFKPFVYLAALNNGFTPANLILDGPIAINQGPGLGMWRPENYTKEYYGLITLRSGLEMSRNLMTVRLADYIGMKNVADYAKRFGIYDNLPPYIALSLGSGETTLLRMVNGYGMIVNGGVPVTPTLIDRVQDRHGTTLYRHEPRSCTACGGRLAWKTQTVPAIADDRKPVADPRTLYQMVSILEGVVQRGTASGAFNGVGRPVAGKTGTTNDYKDAWFIGFTPDLVVGTYIGFDEPKTLGKSETGATAAAPIVREFFDNALKGVPAVPFRIPEGLRMVKLNPRSGQLADPTDPHAIWEAFLPGTEPGENDVVLDNEGLRSNVTVDPSVLYGSEGDNLNSNPNSDGAPMPIDADPTLGTGGLY